MRKLALFVWVAALLMQSCGCIWLAVELGVKNATTGILLVVVVLVRRRPSPPTAHLDQLRQ